MPRPSRLGAGAVEFERQPRQPEQLSAMRPGGRRDAPQPVQTISTNVIQKPAQLTR
jgi:hypothetical protein